MAYVEAFVNGFVIFAVIGSFISILALIVHHGNRDDPDASLSKKYPPNRIDGAADFAVSDLPAFTYQGHSSSHHLAGHDGGHGDSGGGDGGGDGGGQ